MCNISTQNTLITSKKKTHPPHSLFYDINEDLLFLLAYAMNKNEEKGFHYFTSNQLFLKCKDTYLTSYTWFNITKKTCQ